MYEPQCSFSYRAVYSMSQGAGMRGRTRDLNTCLSRKGLYMSMTLRVTTWALIGTCMGVLYSTFMVHLDCAGMLMLQCRLNMRRLGAFEVCHTAYCVNSGGLGVDLSCNISPLATREFPIQKHVVELLCKNSKY